MKSGIMESRGNHRRHGKAKIEDFRSFFSMLSISSMGFHDSKFIGHTGEQFYDDGFHYQAGLFGTTKLIRVDRWKDGDIVREAVDINELPEGIQNLIKAAFA